MEQSDAQAQLEQHHAASYGWALSCCSHNREEAEDVLQTVYLKVLLGRARYDGRSAFKTWLFAVIRRTAADERRRHWLRRLGLAGYARECEMEAISTGPSSPAKTPDAVGIVRTLLARLPRRQQEVLHLAFYQGLSLQEASDVMGVSIGSARTHYERGKQRLREWLNRAECAYEG